MCRASIQYRGWGPNDVRLFAGRSEHIPNTTQTMRVFGPMSNVRVPFTDHVATRANANGTEFASGLAVTRISPGDVGLFESGRGDRAERPAAHPAAKIG